MTAMPLSSDATEAPTLPEVMTVDEAAAFLRVNRKSVYAATHRNAIPHGRIGNRIRFSRAALTLWLRSCKGSSESCKL